MKSLYEKAVFFRINNKTYKLDDCNQVQSTRVDASVKASPETHAHLMSANVCQLLNWYKVGEVILDS